MFHSLSDTTPASAVNWVGFYFLDPKDGKQVILGPFMGKVACQTIRLGQGVCGTVASQGVTEIVPDVEARPGHIACDGETKSEVVVPIFSNGTVCAILDIDCAQLEGFNKEDQTQLEKIAKMLGEHCEW